MEGDSKKLMGLEGSGRRSDKEHSLLTGPVTRDNWQFRKVPCGLKCSLLLTPEHAHPAHPLPPDRPPTCAIADVDHKVHLTLAGLLNTVIIVSAF